MKGRIILLLAVSTTFLLFMFWDLFNNPARSSISIEIYREEINITRSPRKEREPIIFSKSKYLNQTRTVKIFSHSHYLFYYCITILAF